MELLRALARQARADLNIALVERLNSGIVAIDRGLIDLEMCEGFLAHPCFGGRSGWSEQTLFALLASATGRARLLPPSYAVSMESEPAPDRLVARHYSGPSRRWLTASGMPWLLAHGAGSSRLRPDAWPAATVSLIRLSSIVCPTPHILNGVSPHHV